MVYIMIFCHVCFYTQRNYTVQVVGVIFCPGSPKYQPIGLVVKWISHGIVESWSQDEETVGLQRRKHYSTSLTPAGRRKGLLEIRVGLLTVTLHMQKFIE